MVEKWSEKNLHVGDVILVKMRVASPDIGCGPPAIAVVPASFEGDLLKEPNQEAIIVPSDVVAKCFAEETCADRKGLKHGEFCESEGADPAACTGCRAYPFPDSARFENCQR